LITKKVTIGLVVIAMLLSSALNIWIIPSVETIILGDGCIEGKFTGELMVILICLGMIIAGSARLWQMRSRSVVLNKRWILSFLISVTVMTSGGIWLFETLMNLYLCLTFLG
jgi:hypothetical protein